MPALTPQEHALALIFGGFAENHEFEVKVLQYTVPRQVELAKSFARTATTNDNGKSITVGRYTAKKIGGFEHFFLAGTPSGGANWWIETKGVIPREADYTPGSKPEELIARLAFKEAAHHISGVEKAQALRQALQDQIAELHPHNPTYSGP